MCFYFSFKFKIDKQKSRKLKDFIFNDILKFYILTNRGIFNILHGGTSCLGGIDKFCQ